jgi:8-oxo-dGTP pyrophosphatase MutT (NUDIX family)
MNHQTKLFIESANLKLNNIGWDLLTIPIGQDLIKAAVLLPVTVHENELVILFTKRTNSVNNHQSQVSFPGGSIEKMDLNPQAAALRETEEEIGVKKVDIEILGKLKARNTATGFYIYPFVGFIHSLKDININKIEVERIIYIPIKWLLIPENSYTEIYYGQNKIGQTITSFLDYDGEKVWGVTASLVEEFLEIVKK